jgi:hypothetical protein
MQVRCPANNCPIEVSEDLLGARIRCPHCGELVFLEDKPGAAPSPHVQSGTPPGAPLTDPRDALKLDSQIYDGLPPLAVMMALRRQQGRDFDADDFNRRYPMTEDDWKALAAFETGLHASVSLDTAFWLGLAALIANCLVAGLALLSQRGASLSAGGLGAMLGAGLMSTLGVIGVHAGIERLRRVMLDKVMLWVPTCMVALIIVFCLSGVAIFKGLSAGYFEALAGLVALLGLGCNGAAVLATAVAGVRVRSALTGLRPPEISHRLVEALKYLE